MLPLARSRLFSNLPDVVARRRKGEGKKRLAVTREKEEESGEERDGWRNTIINDYISALYQFLETREETSDTTLTIANRREEDAVRTPIRDICPILFSSE